MNSPNHEQNFLERMIDGYVKATEYRDLVEQENPHRDCLNPLTEATIRANAIVYFYPITFPAQEIRKAIMACCNAKKAKELLTTIL